MPLSKAKIKYIRLLEQKKYRKAEGVFLAEGPKLVEELLGKLRCRLLAATDEWLNRNADPAVDELIAVSDDELQRASLLRTPQQVLAVFEQPQLAFDTSIPNHSLCLALDDVQDPGNLGTIVRLADWFGIEHIFCSHGTADIYNPKAIQATMGSIARVHVYYTELSDFFRRLNDCPLYGTFLDGDIIYDTPLSTHGIIVMGNEGKGIHPELAQCITHRLFIPSYPPQRETSESLNVACATAIVCAEFRRQAAKFPCRKE